MTDRLEPPSPAHPLVENDQIHGTAVYDTAGKRIGTIRRLVIEKVSGHVVYAVTAFGGFLAWARKSTRLRGSGCATTRLSAVIEPTLRKASCRTRLSSPGKIR